MQVKRSDEAKEVSGENREDEGGQLRKSDEAKELKQYLVCLYV